MNRAAQLLAAAVLATVLTLPTPAVRAQVITDPLKPNPTATSTSNLESAEEPSPVQTMSTETRFLHTLDPLGLPTWPCKPVGIYRITGYVKGGPGLSDRTADGTSVWTQEKIVAASTNLPMHTLLRVDGLSYTYRVADRGALGNQGWIDVLVDSFPAAYALGPRAAVCIIRYGRG